MPILAQPRDLAELCEIDPTLPAGTGERYGGYGVLGLPFASGHVLALRRFPAAFPGRAYTSLWHRDPNGRWTFWSDQPAEVSCARYFAAVPARIARAPIGIRWTGPRSFHVQVGERAINWLVELRATPATLLLNGLGSCLPDQVRTQSVVSDALARIAGPLLGAGRVQLSGQSPNGPRFYACAERLWMVADSRATVSGESLGVPGPLATQAGLGDFTIPQRGIFAVGRVRFEG